MACYDTSCIFKKGGAEEGTEKSTFKVVHIKKGTFLFDQARKKSIKSILIYLELDLWHLN